MRRYQLNTALKATRQPKHVRYIQYYIKQPLTDCILKPLIVSLKPLMLK